MKKTQISNNLKGKSIEYLKKYLSKKRNRPLSIIIKNKIKKIILKKENTLDKFADLIIKSPLFKLATAEIIREGYNQKVVIKGKVTYDIPPSKTILKMLEIVDVANRQGQKKSLEEYCRRANW